MSGSSKASVIVGVSANGLITIAKFVGFALSGSSAMLSEAIHSVADTGNQSLLYLGLVQSQRPADARHPYGYARDRFFWGLVSALGIFFLGAGVTLYHGIHGVAQALSGEAHEVHYDLVTWGVLLFSLVTEGYAGMTALNGVRKDAKAQGIPFGRYLREGRDPTIAAVLMEDGAAVAGILIAVVCIGLTEVTGHVIFDSLASLLVGLLLAWVAISLVRQNRVFLTIRAVDDDVTERLRALILAHDTVEGLSAVRAVMLGVDTFHVAADVDFDGRKIAEKVVTADDLEAARKVVADEAAFRRWVIELGERLQQGLARETRDLEKKIKDANPQASVVHLESSG